MSMAPDPEPIAGLYAVTTVDTSGVAHVSVTQSREMAIGHFMQAAYMFAHAMPSEVLRVVGDDEDLSLTGLHLIWDVEEGDAVELASLTHPGTIGADKGWKASDYSDREYRQIGAEIDAALSLTEGKRDAGEVKRLEHSRAAYALVRPLAGLILEGDDEKPTEVSGDIAKETWDAMASVRQFVMGTAVIRGG